MLALLAISTALTQQEVALLHNVPETDMQAPGSDLEKWQEARSVWDGYTGVTGEVGLGLDTISFAFLRDGRYLAKEQKVVDGVSKTVLVEQFDGERTITYDTVSNSYVVSGDQGAPAWAEPFQLLWSETKHQVKDQFSQEQLVSTADTSSAMGYTGFLLSFDMLDDSSIVLRSKDMCPFYQLRILFEFTGTVEVKRYPVCQPILYERHCDREVEWSLPPGAKLVDQLKDDNWFTSVASARVARQPVAPC